MEPTQNARVVRAQTRSFYNFSRRYGEQIVLNKVLASETDYATGVPTRTYESITIRNAVYAPPMLVRNVTYTATMMQSIRPTAWQGGAGQDRESVAFLIADRDIKGWGEVDPTQFIVWRDTSYEVVDAQHFDGGVVVNCTVARGSRPS